MYNYRINVYSVETTEGSSWIARFPEVDNCGGSGITVEDAINDAYSNLEFEINCMKEDGKVIPLPQKQNEFSGKLLLRMPKSLHRNLNEIAERENVSLNQYICSALSEIVGCEKGTKKVACYSYKKGYGDCLDKYLVNTEKEIDLINQSERITEQLSSIQGKQEQIMKRQVQHACALLGVSNVMSQYNNSNYRR